VAKKTERKKLTDKLDAICREIVRIRDGMQCQHCDKIVSGSNAHCSHVVPKSLGNNLRFDLINLKILCSHCHLRWWHMNPVEAGEWFQAKFPARWEYLSEQPRLRSFKEWELEELLEELKQKLSELKGELA
jgi:5-methylcytosine-specific restriction endonuclease McrA